MVGRHFKSLIKQKTLVKVVPGWLGNKSVCRCVCLKVTGYLLKLADMETFKTSTFWMAEKYFSGFSTE